MIVRNVLDKSYKTLKKQKIDITGIDSELLLSNILNKNRDDILLNQNLKLNNEQLCNFRNHLNRRKKNEPVSYIIKNKHFWKHIFYIEKGVLIPRPDTELLVEETLKILKKKPKSSVLEIGVGSGCIIISLVKEIRTIRGFGIDISKKCIKIAQLNAKKMNIFKRVKFIKSDIDNFFYGKYDVIISNPPYISRIKYNSLEKGIKLYEPRFALYGGVDGLGTIRKVIKKGSKLLKLNGKLILEIAYDQKNKVISILKQEGFYINNSLKDLSHNDRCVICTKIK